MSTDPIADMLTRVRNAQRAGHKSVRVPYSKVSQSILEVLKTEGYIEGYELKKETESGFAELDAWLKYYGPHEPLIRSLRRISKPGCRVYRKAGNLPQIAGGLGITIVSTSQGVMSGHEARKRKIGGEVIATVG